MNLKELKKILNQDSLSSDQLNDLINTLSKYPFFQPLRMIYITNVKSLSSVNENAIFIPNRKHLYDLLYNNNSYEKADVTNNVDGDRTVELIDSFLDGCDCNNDMPCDMPNDYMTYVLTGDGNNLENMYSEKENDSISSLINTSKSEFVSKRVNGNGDYSLDEENIDDVCFTETLANIYIKQERYDKAMEIIRKLSLKYPKKNIYFANQLETLEKLNINNKSDNKKCTYS